MSATNRSDVRRKDDHYVTPDYAIKRFLEGYKMPSGVWLDPCAANGELIAVARKVQQPDRWLALELRPEAETQLATVVPGNYAIGDFLQVSKTLADKSIDAVFTNPPYSLAVEFLSECLRIAKVTVFLLRGGFLCGGRHELTKQTKPGLFWLPNRPSFTGDGADSSEYAWYVYGDPSVAGRYEMLGESSSVEIKSWNARARKIHAAIAQQEEQRT